MSRREGKRCCEVKWWYCADEVACDSFATEQAKRAIDVKVSPRDDPVAPYRFRPQLQLHMLASLAPKEILHHMLEVKVCKNTSVI